MLCITMKAGEYFTVDGKTVVQYDRLSGDRVRLFIEAPHEVPIMRGEVLERSGGQRPACVKGKSPRFVRQLPWNGAKKRALGEMRQTLARMGDSPEIRLLQEKLDLIFPPSNSVSAD